MGEEDVRDSVGRYAGELFSDLGTEVVDLILSQTYADGTPLFPDPNEETTLESRDDILQLGTLYEHLMESEEGSNRQRSYATFLSNMEGRYDLHFNNPLMVETRAEVQEEYLQQYPPDVGEGVICPKCKSQNTSFKRIQLRGADEATNVIIDCRSCNRTTTY